LPKVNVAIVNDGGDKLLCGLDEDIIISRARGHIVFVDGV
jgi:hypothetical protein|tara:strand:- start:95 stop:214 length:120 start_codon:yes stop_codon:yes gene_type:complete